MTLFDGTKADGLILCIFIPFYRLQRKNVVGSLKYWIYLGIPSIRNISHIPPLVITSLCMINFHFIVIDVMDNKEVIQSVILLFT